VKYLKIDHPHSTAEKYVTVSCGVASTVADSKTAPADLIGAADKGLYEAKERGRNRVILQEL
jgi:diguanylate cyclase (GGDEF)-like protein